MNLNFLKNKWVAAAVSTVVMTAADLLLNKHQVTKLHGFLTGAFAGAFSFGVATAVAAYQNPQVAKNVGSTLYNAGATVLGGAYNMLPSFSRAKAADPVREAAREEAVVERSARSSSRLAAKKRVNYGY
jgi:hypothetical protein